MVLEDTHTGSSQPWISETAGEYPREEKPLYFKGIKIWAEEKAQECCVPTCPAPNCVIITAEKDYCNCILNLIFKARMNSKK